MPSSVEHFIVDPDFSHDNFVACLSHKSMKSLRLLNGSYVLLMVKNSRKIVCTVEKAQCVDGKVRLNRMVRTSLELLLGDAVTLESFYSPMYAVDQVVLAPIDKTVSSIIIQDLWKKFIINKPIFPVFENNHVILRGGNFKVELVFKQVLPNTYGTTHQKTLYKLAQTMPAEEKIWTSLRSLSYDDVGGQPDALNALRKFECLLRCPSLYKAVNPEAARILLEGPKGSGKLFMAKAFANETGAHLVCLNGQDFMNESEKENSSSSVIKRKFDEANENAPSVVCIDDLELLTPSVLQTPLQKSTAAALIKFIKDLTNPSIIVIGITINAAKIHHTVYSAFIRSRNSATIRFTILDLYRRLEILRICTKHMNIAGNSVLYEIAGITDGYTAANLAELCDMANKLRIKNARREILDVTADIEFSIYKKALTELEFKACLIQMKDRLYL